MSRSKVLVSVAVGCLVSAGLALAVACGRAGGMEGPRAVSFAAEQVVTTGAGKTIVSRCRFTPEKLRIEMPRGHGRGSIVTIGRQDLGKAWLLFPEMHRYLEISLAEIGDGRLFLRPLADEIVERLGHEAVEGYRCEKMRVRRRAGAAHGTGEMAATLWIADGFPVPLRTVTPGGTVTVYRNIVVGPQRAELFELPPGYTRMADGLPFPGGR